LKTTVSRIAIAFGQVKVINDLINIISIVYYL